MVSLPVLSVLTMGSLHTEPPPYDFLALIQDEKLLSFLGAGDRAWILRGTAERVFFFI